MNKPATRPAGSSVVTASEGTAKVETATPATEQEFAMVAVTKCEVNGAEYAPGEPFSVTGIDTARWLQRKKAADFADPGSAPAEAATSTGTTNDQASSPSGS